jgi:hypothetical protein
VSAGQISFTAPIYKTPPSGQRCANRLLDAEKAGLSSKRPALAYVTPCPGPTAARPGVWQDDGKRSCVAEGPFDEPRGFSGLCNTMVIVIAVLRPESSRAVNVWTEPGPQVPR